KPVAPEKEVQELLRLQGSLHPLFLHPGDRLQRWEKPPVHAGGPPKRSRWAWARLFLGGGRLGLGGLGRFLFRRGCTELLVESVRVERVLNGTRFGNLLLGEHLTRLGRRGVVGDEGTQAGPLYIVARRDWHHRSRPQRGLRHKVRRRRTVDAEPSDRSGGSTATDFCHHGVIAVIFTRDHVHEVLDLLIQLVVNPAE